MFENKTKSPTTEISIVWKLSWIYQLSLIWRLTFFWLKNPNPLEKFWCNMLNYIIHNVAVVPTQAVTDRSLFIFQCSLNHDSFQLIVLKPQYFGCDQWKKPLVKTQMQCRQCSPASHTFNISVSLKSINRLKVP